MPSQIKSQVSRKAWFIEKNGRLLAYKNDSPYWTGKPELACEYESFAAADSAASFLDPKVAGKGVFICEGSVKETRCVFLTR